MTIHMCKPFYSQWIGIDDCKKPIKSGPTLAGLPGGLAGDLMRLYPLQSSEQYPLRDLVTPTSNAVMLLPYNVNRAKHKQDLEKLYDVEYQTFSDLLAIANNCVILKHCQKISALVAGWSVSTLVETTKTDLCSRFFGKLLKSPNISDKFSLVIKIFSDHESQLLLNDDLFANILDSFKESNDDKDVLIVVNEKNECLTRFLRLRKYQELKTDFLMSGQELMCKVQT